MSTHRNVRSDHPIYYLCTGPYLRHHSGSDATETAEREVGIWFEPSELVNWTPTRNQWIYE